MAVGPVGNLATGGNDSVDTRGSNHALEFDNHVKLAQATGNPAAAIPPSQFSGLPGETESMPLTIGTQQFLLENNFYADVLSGKATIGQVLTAGSSGFGGASAMGGAIGLWGTLKAAGGDEIPGAGRDWADFGHYLSDFALNRSQETSFSSKVFSPNILIKDGKWSEGSNDPWAKVKAHGWGAATATIGVSRPSIASDGTKIRDLSISMSTNFQFENVNDLYIPAPQVPGGQVHYRNLNTINAGPVFNYSLTAREDRIREIALQEKPLPNIFTLDNFEPGDAVSLDTRGMFGVESDHRVMIGRGVSQGGLDGKFDWYNFSGNRVIARMLKAQDGDRHVFILAGQSSSSETSLGAGGIWNPDLGKSQAKRGVQSAFVRGLARDTDTDVHNTFKFVELNIDTPGGRVLYDNILRTGRLPTGAMRQEIPDVLSHGFLDYTSSKDTFNFQAVEYAEVGRSPAKSGKDRPGGQISFVQTWAPFQETEYVRRFDINNVSTGSILPAHTRVYAHDAGGQHSISGFEFKAGTYESVGYNVNNSRLMRVTHIDAATNASNRMYYLSADSVPERKISALLRQNDQRISQGKPPVFNSITLRTPSGGDPLTGAAALQYLENHTDPNGGWFTSEKVDVNVGTANEQDWIDFTSRLTTDAKAYSEEIASLLRWSPRGMEGHAINYTINHLLGASQSAHNYFTQLGHADAKTPESQGRRITADDMGSLLTTLGSYLDAGGGQESYPLHIDVTIRY